MKDTYVSIDNLKAHIKGHGITIKHNSVAVVLKPTKKYIKEHGDGNEEKAIDDLAKWFGLIGKITPTGKVIMTVRGAEE